MSMIKIRILTQQSVLVVFLLANAVNPLLALPNKVQTNVKRKQRTLDLHKELKNLLINKGLEGQVADAKSKKLLKNVENLSLLSKLYESSEFQLSKENILETLCKYALYEKTLELNSYSAHLGFLQHLLGRPLNNRELKELEQIAA